jgi:DNA-binding SARP family transcriptional activator
MPQHPLQVRILGPLEISAGDRPLELRRAKERTLLAALALRVNQVVPLSHLAAALWEDAESPRPPATLRVHVSRLRQALDAGSPGAGRALVTSPPGYVLTMPADAVDAGRFEALARQGRHLLQEGDPQSATEVLGRALAEWRDDALVDLVVSPALRPELVRLDEARQSAIEDRIDAELSCGRHRELVGELEQLVVASPFRERRWAQRMVALYRSGRQAEALRAYEEVRLLLRDELGIVPGPALQRVEQAVLSQDPDLEAPEGGPYPSPEAALDADGPPASSLRFPARLVPPVTPSFSGRSQSLDQLLEAWARRDDGAARVVLVGGEAGVGKTRLVAEAARRIAAEGGIVLFGRCDEDMGVPFQPFVEALDQVVQSGPTRAELGRHPGELVRLVPELAAAVDGLDPPRRADPDTERYRLFDAVTSWLATTSMPAGLLLVVDDLHCAERPTLLLLRHLIRAVGPMRLMIVATYRDTDLHPAHPLTALLADLRREVGVDRLALSGLHGQDARAMLAGVEGRIDARAGDVVELLNSQANGNPFFVGELLRSLVESKRLVERNGIWTTDVEVAELEIPQGVRDVVGRRVARLSETARTVLDLAAILGTTLEFDVVVDVSGLTEDVMLDALDEATSSSLLRESSSGSYEFSHALVRSTLYDDQSALRRARSHRLVAEALEERGHVDAAVLAYHFQRAGRADPRAMDYTAAAGDEAMARLAFDQSVDFYAQALEVAEDLDAGSERRCELLIRYGEAQRLAGSGAYRETLIQAARMAQAHGHAELLARAALANNRGLSSAVGALDTERLELLEAALAALGGEDSTLRARLLAVLALELVWADPEPRRLELAAQARAMAQRLGDESCLLDVWTRANIAGLFADHTPALGAEFPQLLNLAERIGTPEQVVLAWASGALYCVELAELQQFDELVERLNRLAKEMDTPFVRWMEANYHCCRLTITGTGDEIEAAALDALHIGEDAAEPDVLTWFAPQLFVARWSQGRLAEIVDLVRDAARAAPGLPAWRAAQALVCARAGELEEAAAQLETLMLDPSRAFRRNVAWLIGHSVLAEAVVLAGTEEQAAQEYALLAPYAGRVPCLWNIARPTVSLALAGLAARSGRLGTADAHFADACREHERLGATGWLAHAQLGWARLHAARGDRSRVPSLASAAAENGRTSGAIDVVEAASSLLG